MAIAEIPRLDVEGHELRNVLAAHPGPGYVGICSCGEATVTVRGHIDNVRGVFEATHLAKAQPALFRS